MAHVGAYSDISHLYYRDHLWQHPMPYFDYRFEYPVLTGLFVWVASFVSTSDAAYFLTSAALLAALGSAAGVGHQSDRRVKSVVVRSGTGPGLLRNAELGPAWNLPARLRAAPAPAWSRRPRRGGAGPGHLGQVLPDRRRTRDRRAAPRRSQLALRGSDRRDLRGTTLAVNLPFAITGGAQGPIRANWSYFFTFTAHRPPRATIWQPLLGHGADAVTTPLFAAGLAAIVILAVRARGRPGGSFIPAATAALLWVFATAKVYSPQYALWIFAALAIDGAPVGLAVAFGLVDLLIFTTTFGPLHPVGPIASDFPARGAVGCVRGTPNVHRCARGLARSQEAQPTRCCP